MRFSLSRQLKFFQPQIELLLLFGLLLFFPDKLSYSYYFLAALLLSFFSLLHLWKDKLSVRSPFTYFLFFFNSIFIFSALFANYPQKSLLFCSDLLLITFYFMLLPEFSDQEYSNLLNIFFIFITFAVALNGLFFFILQQQQASILFKNPILSGFLAAIGAIFFFSALLEKISWKNLSFLLINLSGLILNASKGPLLIFFLITLFLIIRKKRALFWLPILFMLIMLIIPSPLQKRLLNMKNDPFLTTRMQIWQTSLQMFRKNIWHGVGADLFEEKAYAFNFANPSAPANFFKRPESPHNDFLKILSETGISGLLFLLAIFFYFLKKHLTKNAEPVVVLLTAGFLFQMNLINFIFQPFFLIFFLFLLKKFLAKECRYQNKTYFYKFIYSFLILFVFLFFYLLPTWSDKIQKSISQRHPLQRMTALNFLNKIDPLNHQPYFQRGIILLEYCRIKNEFATSAWLDALNSFQQSSKLNPYNIAAYQAQLELWKIAWQKRIYGAEIEKQILKVLFQAETVQPFNVFIKQQIAETFFQSGNRTAARLYSEQALQLEPFFARALLFLHKNFSLFSSAELQSRLKTIRQKYEKYKPAPGSYLYNLWLIPNPQQQQP